MVKKILLGYFAVAFCIVGVMVLTQIGAEPGAGYVAACVMEAVACFVIAFFLGRACLRTKTKKQQLQEEQAVQQQRLERKARQAAQADSMTALPVVPMPGALIAKPGEVCHFHAPATTLVVKNQVVGRTGTHVSSSVRIAKGVSLRTGKSQSQSVRDDVGYSYPGYLTVTSQRIVMTGDKGFDAPVGKLTALTYYGNGDGLQLQFGSSTYTLLLDDPYSVVKIVHLVNA